MPSGDYHRFVFDTANRRLVGDFDAMYRAEDSEGFDSWHERDLRPLRKRLSLAVLDGYQWGRILDVGCGKGTLTHLLKKANNRVVGVDSSETAIQKARASFPDIDFRCLPMEEIGSIGESFDLAVVMGSFAYVERWPTVLQLLHDLAPWLYIAEYVPPDPIGFVKSIDELVGEVSKLYSIQTRLVLDDEHCMLLARGV
jgi:SAM-dependent methyltransferase